MTVTTKVENPLCKFAPTLLYDEKEGTCKPIIDYDLGDTEAANRYNHEITCNSKIQEWTRTLIEEAKNKKHFGFYRSGKFYRPIKSP